ncbi:VirB8/TrbF family protein [Candidatus Neoehrlichia procyonis]|uniref:VirB8 family protein n=1 Tax=Candidatus Neoehrlichia procyonis str. RAC413 TaxID=1359163 RepID=A0A0F3NMJ8_9RICK|nr:VirB8/TrbF family protein [Candidatus Neoehrlichia lotoris]KJV68932.1 virB8 family protein [Candidatus Neoehrlichia lotoris str. RAC413]
MQKFNKQKYFDDALDWYCDQYLFCATERSWLFGIVLILLVFLVALMINIYSLFPIKKDFTFIKYSDRYSDEFSKIKKLSHNNEESEEVLLANYLVGQYVKRYESYSNVELDNQLNFIKNNSSRKVFLAFKDAIEFNIIQNLIPKYPSKVVEIETNIKNVTLLKKGSSSLSGAIIKAHKKYFVSGAVVKSQTFTVQINFSLSNIKMAVSGVMPLEFTVHSYRYVD